MLIDPQAWQTYLFFGFAIYSGVATVPGHSQAELRKRTEPSRSARHSFARRQEGALYIQIHTDNQIESDRARDAKLEEQVRDRLKRFNGRITDVEIHVSDVNGPRNGLADLKCTLEARVNGIAPIAVSGQGATVDRAVMAAAKTAVSALDRQLGKLNGRR
jgi:hypothetical protein